MEGGISAQTERVLENMKAVLEACGASLDSVLKTTVFLKDMADFPHERNLRTLFHQRSAGALNSASREIAARRERRDRRDRSRSGTNRNRKNGANALMY